MDKLSIFLVRMSVRVKGDPEDTIEYAIVGAPSEETVREKYAIGAADMVSEQRFDVEKMELLEIVDAEKIFCGVVDGPICLVALISIPEEPATFIPPTGGLAM